MNANGLRGLTLIEVLASVVLLSMIAGACTSLLRDAAAGSRASGSSDSADGLSIERLGLLADAVLADSDAFGIHSLQEVTEQELQLPDDFGDLASATIVMQRLESASPDAEHFWLVLTAVRGEHHVAATRWVLKPEEPADQEGAARR